VLIVQEVIAVPVQQIGLAFIALKNTMTALQLQMRLFVVTGLVLISREVLQEFLTFVVFANRDGLQVAQILPVL
jgi:hypothetical protein